MAVAIPDEFKTPADGYPYGDLTYQIFDFDWQRFAALLRLQELESLRELARTANARIYIGFDKHLPVESTAEHNGQ